ncbi:MAG: hypothetical protein P8175_03470 [Deltaproteobacteria bacterium]
MVFLKAGWCREVPERLPSVETSGASSACAAGYQKSAIRHITKNDEGRLRGHYIVDLEILEG